MTPTLSSLAEEFASDLTRTVQVVAGAECSPFVAIIPDTVDAAAVFVQQRPTGGIVLSTEAGPLLRLTVEFKCTMDSAGRYLAVSSSSMKVFSADEEIPDPLLRYEYVRDQQARLPAAHLHVHGDHPALVATLQQVGACVRDAPEEAVRVLRELGYTITLPPQGEHLTRTDRLRAP